MLGMIICSYLCYNIWCNSVIVVVVVVLDDDDDSVLG